MDFRTRADIGPLGFKIGYSSSGVVAGSCFAENMGGRMRRIKMPVAVNPFGVLFNPASIADMFDRLSSGHVYGEAELVENGGLWSSPEHHGMFSAVSPAEVLSGINCAVREGQAALRRAEYVIVTFGTAWVYEYRRTGKVAANCHKLPASDFIRRRQTVADIVAMFEGLLSGPLKGKKIVFTVSPVRHLRDGMAGNQISKSTLLLAVDELVNGHTDCFYFPAYEIMMDDLRDYRFYGEDMVHPSKVAVDYIWDMFIRNVFDAETLALAERVENIVAASEHRPLNPDTAAHRDFKNKMLGSIERLHVKYPCLDFSEEIAIFRQ